MKKLLIVTTNFPPSASIGTQRVLRICKFLNPDEYNISVLTVKEKYHGFNEQFKAEGRFSFLQRCKVTRTGKMDPVLFMLELRSKFQKKGKSSGDGEKKTVHTIDAVLAGKKVSIWQRLKDIGTDLMHFPDKNITFLPLAFFKGLGIIRREKTDIIFATAPPHSMLLIAALLKVFTRKKLVIDFRDPWARSPWLEEQRQSSAYERFKTRIIARMERFVVRLADRCIFVTPEMCEDFKQFYPHLPQDKFQVFFNGFDPANLPVQNGNGNGKHHEPITFVHTGVLYRRRDPRPVMHAVKELVDEGTIEPGKVMFRFVGGITAELASVKDLIGELELENVFEFVSKVPYQESLKIMQDSDVLLLLQPVSKLQIPGKFYDYICFGKPILAISEPEGAVDRLVDKEFGIATDYNSKDDIKRGIKSFLNGQYDNSEIKERRQRFDMSVSIRQFEKMIDV